MVYRIEVTPRAGRDLKALPLRERQRLADQIDAMKDNPRPQGCRKLMGRGDFYRIRVGDYRVVGNYGPIAHAASADVALVPIEVTSGA